MTLLERQSRLHAAGSTDDSRHFAVINSIAYFQPTGMALINHYNSTRLDFHVLLDRKWLSYITSSCDLENVDGRRAINMQSRLRVLGTDSNTGDEGTDILDKN